MLVRMFREPLFWFLVGGVLIFTVDSSLSGSEQHQAYRVALDEVQIEALKSAWKQERGRMPTEEHLKKLIQAEIMEEILFREAQRLDLGNNDRVIKRRLIQKYRVMLNDTIFIPEVDEQTLAAHYQGHLEQYQTPGNISLEHVFFSHSTRVDPQGDAATAYAKYKENLHAISDSFPGPTHLEDYQEHNFRQLFGAVFYERLRGLSSGEWSDPIESAYGWHLVYIHKKTGTRQLSFEDSREMVLNHVRNLKRREAKKATLTKLVSKYSIEVPKSVPGIEEIGLW